MSRFQGRWSIHNAKHLRDTCPDDFELVREVVGYRLCGVSDVGEIRELVHVNPSETRPSVRKIRRILSCFGQTLRMAGHHEFGLWFPFGSGCGEYLSELFNYPAWLPHRGLKQYGYTNDPRVIDHDKLRENVRRFEEDHIRYCRERGAHQRQESAVSHVNAAARQKF